MNDRITHVLWIQYDGTNYSGWQRQSNGISVQQSIEDALYELTNHQITILGSGRTDAGVHARGQIAHFKISEDIFTVPHSKIKRAINSRLPKDIRIIGHCIPNGDFHCTRDANYREYSYTITTMEDVFKRMYSTYFPYPFDIQRLLHSSAYFLGEYDFTSFSKYNAATKSYICNVQTCSWSQQSPHVFTLRIGANRFVYAMVRSIVGAMLEYARGTISEEDIKNMLALPRRSSTRNIPVAEPHGLVLEKVQYPDFYGIVFQ